MSTPPSQSKKAVTIRLDADLVERMKTFCRDQAGKPLYLTIHGLVGQAVEHEMQRLELILRDDATDRFAEPPTVDADRRLATNHRARTTD